MNPLELIWRLIGGDVSVPDQQPSAQESGYDELMRKRKAFDLREQMTQPPPTPEAQKAYQKQRTGEREMYGLNINPWIPGFGELPVAEQNQLHAPLVELLKRLAKEKKEK